MIDAYVGVDIGSATVKVVGVDGEGRWVGTPAYLRLDDFPNQVTALKEAFRRYLNSALIRVLATGTTGSGRELHRHVIGGDLSRTEIFAHAVGITDLVRQGLVRYQDGSRVTSVGTVLEIGGQDAKIIVFSAEGVPVYFNMNTICSAGTGEFLKQLADDAGIALADFGRLALASRLPAQIDATCTVFSRRDFRHLTQKGVPLADRLMGVCHAMVNNYILNVVKGYPLRDPIIFQGGVAYNEGVRQAFEARLGRPVIVPPHHELLGALGMALIVREHALGQADAERRFNADFLSRAYESRIRHCHGCQNACELTQAIEVSASGPVVLDTLGGRCEGSRNPHHVREVPLQWNRLVVPVDRRPPPRPVPARRALRRASKGLYFAGIDGGSRGTKYAVILSQGAAVEVVDAGSVDTAGDAIQAIRSALEAIRRALPGDTGPAAVGTTGSAGELARDMLIHPPRRGADYCSTEILAHYAWADYMLPGVRTVLDIGGNDAKIITIGPEGISFAMNDKCAAGSGSFIEAVTRRFHVPLDRYGEIALSAEQPARIAGRCAVFGESDLVHKARLGYPTADLLLGLAYALCRTYFSDVGKGKTLRLPIVAQGGTFLNAAVQRAFRETLDLTAEELVIASDPRLVVGAGALGAALLAKEQYELGLESHFKGFDTVLRAHHETVTITCRQEGCHRTCRGVVALLEDGRPIAGYKSVDCDYGYFDGTIDSRSEHEHVARLLAAE